MSSVQSGGGGDEGHVEVDEEVVEARRRHVVPQHLEQHAGIAIGEAHFLARERAVGVDARHGLGRFRLQHGNVLACEAQLGACRLTAQAGARFTPLTGVESGAT